MINFAASLLMGLLVTVAMCLGIIFLKWIMAQVTVNLFCAMLIILTMIFLIVLLAKEKK